MLDFPRSGHMYEKEHTVLKNKSNPPGPKEFSNNVPDSAIRAEITCNSVKLTNRLYCWSRAFRRNCKLGM